MRVRWLGFSAVACYSAAVERTRLAVEVAAIIGKICAFLLIGGVAALFMSGARRAGRADPHARKGGTVGLGIDAEPLLDGGGG